MENQNNLKTILNSISEKKNSAFFYTPLQKGNEISYLFQEPTEIIESESEEDFQKKLQYVDILSNKYKYAFGYLSYEAGYLLEEKLKPLFKKGSGKIFRFYFFDEKSVKKIPTKNLSFNKIETSIINREYEITGLKLNISQTQFEENISKIKGFIKQGDTYQVNYTLKTKFDFKGELTSFVGNLIFNQSANYTAFIAEGDKYIISFSPELFFKTEGTKIFTKPMKGTIKRGKNSEDDKIRAYSLFNSEKDRAENIMIVDLLRNDIGRICKFNTVKMDSAFDIEKYETLFQMTSKVSGELENKSFSRIIKNLFPCGSITGAPKIKTMEIINQLEKEPRGIYTGTIGIIENGDFNFNIPIRTISINTATGKGEMGIGSGVVWDSNPTSEFDETKLKSNFLIKQNNYFELIETMLVENGKVFLLENHILRLKESAEYFLFFFNETKLISLLDKIEEQVDKDKKYRLKILLSKWGEIKYSIEKILERNEKGKIVFSRKKVNSDNPFQYFKTTNRELYNSEFNECKKKGFTDVIFLNENGEITEGAISNIMILREGIYYTPPLSSGLLNGCYRKYLLDTKENILEKILFPEDLFSADEIIIFNSVRKEVKVELSTDI